MDGPDTEAPQFWKLQDIEASYWDEYIATRPVYDLEIFRRLDDYLSRHPSSRSSALDIGTGSGSVIEPLMKRFEHVVATDNDPTSLSFAKNRHSSFPAESLSYTLSSGEDLLEHHSPGSFDLITCAETFPLMDTQTALDNISTLLRPGGTLAIWFYGPPFFTKSEFTPRCQEILDSIMDHNFRPVVSGCGDVRKESWKRATDGMYSWLDYIPLTSEKWKDVHRHKWNTHARLSFFSHRACDFPVEPVRSVGRDDVISEEQNSGFWEVRWDVKMIRDFVKASFPKPRGLVGQDEIMDELFQKLAEEMGGNEVTRTLSWPAVLILAAKRE
ncbi:S-adenosyl-L-methionine-dependent methyltransferase [Hypoxylon sp. FL1857]|nr:S-adenosyl-L-methionine-dependent methyltransferase [Hypoxylon sp. FL1857]